MFEKVCDFCGGVFYSADHREAIVYGEFVRCATCETAALLLFASIGEVARENLRAHAGDGDLKEELRDVLSVERSRPTQGV
jgi:hypothetical protein